MVSFNLGYTAVHRFNGATWTPAPALVAPNPQQAANGSVYFDSSRNRITLIGFSPGQYWEWTGTNWVQFYSPSPVLDVGIVADAPQRGVALCMKFAISATNPQPDTYLIADRSFNELALSDWPAERDNHLLVYDELRDTFVLHGGAALWPGTIYLQDTWELQLGTEATFSTFGQGCQGSNGIPTIFAQGLPQIGSTLHLQVNRLPFGSFAFMFLGFSDTDWSGIPLPLNLGVLGAPGCYAFVSGDTLYAMPNVLGVGLWSVAIPNVPGLTFYNQAAAFDATVNPLGLVFSNAGESVIGF